MSKKVAVVIGVLSLLTTGCTFGERTEYEPKELYQLSKKQFYNQDSYAFDGTISRVTDVLKNQNETMFTGRVMNRYDLYIRVNQAVPEETDKEEYGVLTLDGMIYEKTAREKAWEKAQNYANATVKMQKWNPTYYFQMMENWATSFDSVSQEAPINIPTREVRNDYLESFRVQLDPERVRPWIVKHLKNEGTDIQEDDVTDVSAYMNVYVNTKTDLPTSLQFHVNTDYTTEEQRIHAQRRMNLYFRGYGEEFDLPRTAREITP